MSAGVRVDVPEIGLIEPADTEKMLKASAAAILSSVQLSFRSSTDPHGAKWPVLSPATIRRRRKGSDKPLLDTGVLLNSYQASAVYPDAAGGAIDVGSNMEYAAIHNFGGMARRNRAIKIPKRQHLPDPANLPDELQDELAEISINTVMRAL